MLTFPHSKINIGLNIIDRRPDGYHNIQSIMVPIGWSDILEIVPAAGKETTLTVTGRPVCCPPEKNLVMKALRAVEKVSGPLPPVDIFLRKIVPDGAGLGGGSADAAATVSLLNGLFDLGLTDTTMAEICSTVGADCPFFIYGRPMAASGNGTTLCPIDLPGLEGLTVVVTKPDISISTAEAYGGITPSGTAWDLGQLAASPRQNWKSDLINLFERPMAASHPEIGTLVDLFYEHGACYAAMSGSGSAVFGLFESDILAEKAAASVRPYATWYGPIL